LSKPYRGCWPAAASWYSSRAWHSVVAKKWVAKKSITRLAAAVIRSKKVLIIQAQVRSTTLIIFTTVFLQQGNGENPVRWPWTQATLNSVTNMFTAPSGYHKFMYHQTLSTGKRDCCQYRNIYKWMTMHYSYIPDMSLQDSLRLTEVNLWWSLPCTGAWYQVVNLFHVRESTSCVGYCEWYYKWVVMSSLCRKLLVGNRIDNGNLLIQDDG